MSFDEGTDTEVFLRSGAVRGEVRVAEKSFYFVSLMRIIFAVFRSVKQSMRVKWQTVSQDIF